MKKKLREWAEVWKRSILLKALTVVIVYKGSVSFFTYSFFQHPVLKWAGMLSAAVSVAAVFFVHIRRGRRGRRAARAMVKEPAAT